MEKGDNAQRLKKCAATLPLHVQENKQYRKMEISSQTHNFKPIIVRCLSQTPPTSLQIHQHFSIPLNHHIPTEIPPTHRAITSTAHPTAQKAVSKLNLMKSLSEGFQRTCATEASMLTTATSCRRVNALWSF